MRRTLLLIPHEIGGIPIFGIGIALVAVVVALALRLWVARRNGQSLGTFLAGEGLMWGLAGIVVVFVLPMVELRNVDGEPVGMAIRGYGVMLLAGVFAAVALAAYRAKRMGINPEIIYALAPWAFVGGIVGARVFFVIQYFDQFVGDSIVQTIGNMLRFTEGGLVVYGSFIGGFIAAAYFIKKHRLPLLKFGDIIVPCLFIGVFFGRMGCLMNGCCYGGRCEDHWAALHFPPGSPVYEEQLRSGELLGITADPASQKIEQVADESLARKAGIQAGSQLELVRRDASDVAKAEPTKPAEEHIAAAVASVDGRRYRWAADDLPARAMPVYAAQLLSSVSSLVLCLLLCSLSYFRLRTGTVMMLGFASYAVLRFGLEWVRVDEVGRFGTDLSIGQFVSIAVFAASMIGLWWVYRSPTTGEHSSASAVVNS